MVEFMLTSGVIFLVLTGWQYVEHRYRRFAEDNPALGPYRPEGGCGDGCSCSGGGCTVDQQPPASQRVRLELPRADQPRGGE